MKTTGDDARRRHLPRLPPLHPTAHNKNPIPLDMRGPTPWSNYVIQGRVLAGAFPAVVNDDDTNSILLAILKAGVDAFVCLQAEFRAGVSEISWRSGKTLRPYIRDAQKLIMRAKEVRGWEEGLMEVSDEDASLLNIGQEKLDLLHLPIVDGSISSDQSMSDLADDCCQRVLKGQRLYIHCWGGHGRTGTLVAIMLSRLYGLSGLDALHYTQMMHDVRISSQNTASPQTRSQVLQVLRLTTPHDASYGLRKYAWPAAPLLPFTAIEEAKWKRKHGVGVGGTIELVASARAGTGREGAKTGERDDDVAGGQGLIKSGRCP
jgi:protein-tyrosine phosphatase